MADALDRVQSIGHQDYGGGEIISPPKNYFSTGMGPKVVS